MSDMNAKEMSAGSPIQYNIVMCPRYLKNIFCLPGVEKRFRQLMEKIADDNGFEIVVLDCGNNYFYLRVRVPLTFSPTDVVNTIKNGTSRQLISEFDSLSKIPNLWTRNFYASTADKLDSFTIRQFVASQKRDRSGEKKDS